MTAATTTTATMSSTHKSSTTSAPGSGAPVTSPMQQQQESTTSAIAGAGGGVDGKRSLPKGAHVRFSHVESVDHTKMGGATNAQAANAGEYILSYVPNYILSSIE